MRRRATWMLLFAGPLLFVSGCGTKPIPVKGTLMVDKQPLANATVQLVSQERGGRDAVGTTDADGAFHLTTIHLRDGALPGQYKVVIHYSEPVKIPSNLRTAEEVQAAMAEAAAAQIPTLVLPSRYRRPDQTPLTHRVPDNGDLRLELSRQK